MAPKLKIKNRNRRKLLDNAARELYASFFNSDEVCTAALQCAMRLFECDQDAINLFTTTIVHSVRDLLRKLLAVKKVLTELSLDERSSLVHLQKFSKINKQISAMAAVNVASKRRQLMGTNRYNKQKIKDECDIVVIDDIKNEHEDQSQCEDAHNRSETAVCKRMIGRPNNVCKKFDTRDPRIQKLMSSSSKSGLHQGNTNRASTPCIAIEPKLEPEDIKLEDVIILDDDEPKTEKTDIELTRRQSQADLLNMSSEKRQSSNKKFALPCKTNVVKQSRCNSDNVKGGTSNCDVEKLTVRDGPSSIREATSINNNTKEIKILSSYRVLTDSQCPSNMVLEKMDLNLASQNISKIFSGSSAEVPPSPSSGISDIVASSEKSPCMFKSRRLESWHESNKGTDDSLGQRTQDDKIFGDGLLIVKKTLPVRDYTRIPRKRRRGRKKKRGNAVQGCVNKSNGAANADVNGITGKEKKTRKKKQVNIGAFAAEGNAESRYGRSVRRPKRYACYASQETMNSDDILMNNHTQ